mgnify:CR=1 FL=1
MIILAYVMAGLIMGLGALYLVWLGQKQAQEEAVSKRLFWVVALLFLHGPRLTRFISAV